jgi:hypothetical protein
MRHPCMDSRPQSPTRPLQTTRRTPTVATLLTWLTLGTGVVVLLGLLTAELIPAVHTLVRFPSSAALVSDQPWAPREEEPLELVPFTLDDCFARL